MGRNLFKKKRPTRNPNMHRHSMMNIVSFLPKKFQKWNGYFFVHVWPPRIDPMVFSLVKMKLLTQRLITHVPGEYTLSIRCRWHCGYLFSISSKIVWFLTWGLIYSKIVCWFDLRLNTLVIMKLLTKRLITHIPSSFQYCTKFVFSQII